MYLYVIDELTGGLLSNGGINASVCSMEASFDC